MKIRRQTILSDRFKLGVVAASGALAALGGALFAHHNTYIEPRNFDIMLGVHSLAYALIGGLGTALGPLLGVVLDLGVLEASRFLAGTLAMTYSRYRTSPMLDTCKMTPRTRARTRCWLRHGRRASRPSR